MPPPNGPLRDIISPPEATLNQGKEIIIHCMSGLQASVYLLPRIEIQLMFLGRDVLEIIYSPFQLSIVLRNIWF